MAVLTLIISLWNAFATQRVVDVIPFLSKPITDKDDPLMLMMEEVQTTWSDSRVGPGRDRSRHSRYLLPGHTRRRWFGGVRSRIEVRPSLRRLCLIICSWVFRGRSGTSPSARRSGSGASSTLSVFCPCLSCVTFRSVLSPQSPAAPCPLCRSADFWPCCRQSSSTWCTEASTSKSTSRPPSCGQRA